MRWCMFPVRARITVGASEQGPSAPCHLLGATGVSIQPSGTLALSRSPDGEREGKWERESKEKREAHGTWGIYPQKQSGSQSEQLYFPGHNNIYLIYLYIYIPITTNYRRYFRLSACLDFAMASMEKPKIFIENTMMQWRAFPNLLNISSKHIPTIYTCTVPINVWAYCMWANYVCFM